MNLSSHHLADLRASGLNDETIEASGVWSANREQASKIFGGKLGCGALVFPGDGFFRLKPDSPIQHKNGRTAKYLSAKGSCNRLYVPPTLSVDALDNRDTALIITEGEKKALKAVQEGLPCVALPGVWCWRENAGGTSKPIADLDGIPWEGRRVFIVYDSDAKLKESISKAQFALAQHLSRDRDADVWVVRLPYRECDGGKCGLDDFLIHKGRKAFDEVCDHAIHFGQQHREGNELSDTARSSIDFTSTDDGNAERLANRHGDRIRFCYSRGWLVWDGRRWSEDRTGEVRRLAVDAARAITKEADQALDTVQSAELLKWAGKSLSNSRLRAMIEGAQSKPPVPSVVEKFDQHPLRLNLFNGTYDLGMSIFEDHRRADMLTKLAPVEYDADAKSPTWEDFLTRVLNEDDELIDFLQRAVGYSLSGDTSEECLFICHGSGQNGKSTFLETLVALLGDYALQTPSHTLMRRRGSEGVPNDVARLAGARFVVANESEEGRNLDESKVKVLTGGDRIPARFLHCEYFEFQPEFKLWLACNHKPTISGSDYAIWRRIRLIPFSVQIPENERDPTLKGRDGKLRRELPGILNWALRGFQKWRDDGLKPPSAVSEATREYRSDMDVLSGFLDERCVEHAKSTVQTSDLNVEYRDWCKQNGYSPVSPRGVGLRLGDRGYHQVRGTGGTRLWQGLRLR